MSAGAKRSKHTKRNLAAGGVVAGLIALGMWLASLIPGLGFGLGGGNGVGIGTNDDGEPKTEQKTPEPPEPEKLDPQNVVEVTIDDAGVRLRRKRGEKTEFTSVEPAQIVDAARRVPDDQTVKVRIWFYGPGSRSDLRQVEQALRKAGLKEREFETVYPDFRDR